MKAKRNIFKKIVCLTALLTMLIGSTLTASAEGDVTAYWKADGTYTFVNDDAVPEVGTNGLPLYHKEYSKSVVEVSSVTPGGIYIYGVWNDIYTPEQIALLYSVIDASGITNEMPKYDKAVALNNAVCSVFEYDNEYAEPLLDGLLALQMFRNSGLQPKAKCDGYSDLYQTLCQAVGIDCQKAAGISTQGRHMWNVLSIDGKEYYNDVTWNEGTGNAYLMWETPIHEEEWFNTKTPEGRAQLEIPIEHRAFWVRNYGPEDLPEYNVNNMKKASEADVEEFMLAMQNHQNVITKIVP